MLIGVTISCSTMSGSSGCQSPTASERISDHGSTHHKNGLRPRFRATSSFHSSKSLTRIAKRRPMFLLGRARSGEGGSHAQVVDPVLPRDRYSKIAQSLGLSRRNLGIVAWGASVRERLLHARQARLCDRLSHRRSSRPIRQQAHATGWLPLYAPLHRLGCRNHGLPDRQRRPPLRAIPRRQCDLLP